MYDTGPHGKPNAVLGEPQKSERSKGFKELEREVSEATTTKVYDNDFRLEIAPHSSGPSLSFMASDAGETEEGLRKACIETPP
jgi:hypothetical protein